MEKRWNEIKHYWQKHSPSWLFLGLAFGLLLGFGLGFLTGNYGRFIWENESIAGFIQDFWPEALGIVLTVGWIDRILQRNAKKREEVEKLEDLIQKAVSQERAIAVPALEELDRRRILAGEAGVLREKQLSNTDWINTKNIYGINLSKSRIYMSNLSGTIFWFINFAESVIFESKFLHANMMMADFSNCHCFYSDLSHTTLQQANFSSATMHLVNFKGTGLWETKFNNANLAGSDFSGAKLNNADLTGAKLFGSDKGISIKAVFDQNTILPDGTNYIPELGLEQMKRFGCIIDAD